MTPVPTSTLSAAMRHLAETIESDDGVDNACCLQAAERLDEQQTTIERQAELLRKFRVTP